MAGCSMAGKPIKYVGYFDFQDSEIPRFYSLAASNKMEYIAEAINNAGRDVELVSVSASAELRFKWQKAEVKARSPHFRVRFFSTFGGSGTILHILRTLWHKVALLMYLLFHTRKNEPVVVYHSLGYFNSIIWAKRVKKFRLILEVEEIYQDVGTYSERVKHREYAMFDAADAYIFSTNLLVEQLNRYNKPYVVIAGTYHVEPPINAPVNDGKIHVVYAGTFDIRKGAAAAAAAARFMPENYHLHICGFGNATDTAHIKEVIAQTALNSQAAITYDGMLKGKDYIALLQRCHIGLSTQDPSAAFNTTSFPSKILSYLANGLRVVSIRIDAVVHSVVGKHLTYYSEQTPQTIARAILDVDMNAPFDARQIVEHLNKEFVAKIGELLRQKF